MGCSSLRAAFILARPGSTRAQPGVQGGVCAGAGSLPVRRTLFYNAVQRMCPAAIPRTGTRSGSAALFRAEYRLEQLCGTGTIWLWNRQQRAVAGADGPDRVFSAFSGVAARCFAGGQAAAALGRLFAADSPVLLGGHSALRPAAPQLRPGRGPLGPGFFACGPWGFVLFYPHDRELVPGAFRQFFSGTGKGPAGRRRLAGPAGRPVPQPRRAAGRSGSGVVHPVLAAGKKAPPGRLRCGRWQPRPWAWECIFC